MNALLSTPLSAELIHGALELETTPTGLLPHRLPAWARAQADGQLSMAEAQPSGVRVVMQTRATTVELETIATKVVYVGAPPRPDGVYDLVVDGRLAVSSAVGGGRTMTIDMMTGTSTVIEGSPGTVRFTGLDDRPKTVEIWLPWNETTELLQLRTDAPVEAVAPDVRRRTWVHHGSSISHGSVAASPTRTWVSTAARIAQVDPINLGFGGSALLDPFVARTIRDIPADLISLKVGINLVNTDLMRLRAFVPAVNGFLDTIREGHARTPILLVSAILCPIHEATPGPSVPDFAEGTLKFRASGHPGDVAAGKLTLETIREALVHLVETRAATDPNLAYLDGRVLYGQDSDDQRPLPDALHPDSETQVLIGERFAQAAFGAGGFFQHS